jgi:diadenosine tetraphosphate (Ap4A) HIT family hydrolase
MELLLEKLNESCLFCNPALYGQEKQVLLRSDHFYIFAGLGPIIEGYLIIVPYQCKMSDNIFRSISDLSNDDLDELSFLRNLISEFYKDTYGHPGLSFEHGRAGG